MLANFYHKNKSKITIQLDDDNFILKNDFFGSLNCWKKIRMPLYGNKDGIMFTKVLMLRKI